MHTYMHTNSAHIHVCMYICMYILDTYIPTLHLQKKKAYIGTHAKHIYIRTHTSMYAHMHVYIAYIHTNIALTSTVSIKQTLYTCIYACMYVCMYVCRNVYIYIYIYIERNMHIYTHMHTYIHMRTHAYHLQHSSLECQQMII